MTIALKRHHNQRVIQNRIRTVKLMETDRDSVKYIIRDKGRLRKKHPYDCGESKCYTCHSGKLLNVRKKVDIENILSEY